MLPVLQTLISPLILFDSSSVDPQSAPPPFRPTLSLWEKYLKNVSPGGARDSAAAEFQQSLSGVVEHPPEGERKLDKVVCVCGGGALCQPADHRRGGKRGQSHSLGCLLLQNKCLHHLKRYPSSSGGRQDQRTSCGKDQPKPIDADTSAARRATAKMDEGDVKGAIRQLCSSDKLMRPSHQSYLDLLAKHPSAPSDRRSLLCKQCCPHQQFLSIRSWLP